MTAASSRVVQADASRSSKGATLKHILKIAAAVAFGLVLGSLAHSQNSLDLFRDIYSTADGSVQFIVLRFGPSPILAGQKLIVSDGKTEHSFTFPSNVVNESGECDVGIVGLFCAPYAYVLLATQGFVDLNVVKPDFVVPNGFLFVPSGTVRLGDSEYGYLLPQAYGEAEAENNASEYYSFDTNFSGLWWADPAGSESGWGINFAHQGNTIFATWFTYDSEGKPWWLTMTANRTFARQRAYREWVYTGTLYSPNGSPFSAFVPPAALTPAGSGTLRLGDTTGLFTYAMNDGTTQTKAITLQTFGPVPTCVWGMQPDLTKATNFQGLWWAAPAESEPGWGVNLTQQGTTIFATWFTYKANHDSLWLSVTARQTAPNTFSGALDRTTGPAFDSAHFGQVQHHPAGTATFTFTDGNTGTFAYDVDLGDGVNRASQAKAITRQVFHPPGTVCQ